MLVEFSQGGIQSKNPMRSCWLVVWQKMGLEKSKQLSLCPSGRPTLIHPNQMGNMQIVYINKQDMIRLI